MQASGQTRPAIRLYGTKPQAEVSADNVYYPFESGRLDYDCVTCGAKCCKGFGYLAASKTELQRQLTERPSLGFFTAPHDHVDGVHIVSNCAPGCFFLTTEGLCETQRKYGYAAKPETCRLFPFNSFMIVDGFLIVAPNSGLCPIKVLTGEARSDLSSHSRLTEEMVRVGISGPIRLGIASYQDTSLVVKLEKQILSETATVPRGRAYWRFAARTVQLTSESLGQGDVSTDRCTEVMKHFVEECAGVLDMEIHLGSEGGDIDDLFVALTPHLRSSLIFQTSPGGSNRPPIDLGRVPYAIVALRLITELARKAGMRDITFQTVMALQVWFGDIVLLLSDCDRVVGWHPEADMQLGGRSDAIALAYLRVANDLLPSVQRQRRLTLGAVLKSHGSLQACDRVLYLRHVAKRLSGRIVPIEMADASYWPRLGFRIKRLGLKVLGG